MSMPRGVGLKMLRAHEHLLNLETEIDYYLNSGPQRIIVEVRQHVDGSQWVLIAKWKSNGPTPERISALVGDLVHNLRSALDHLACGLVMARTQKSCPTGPGGTQFPIFTEPTGHNGKP